MTWNTNAKSHNDVRLVVASACPQVVVLTEARQPPTDLYEASSAWWFGEDTKRGVLVLGFDGAVVEPVGVAAGREGDCLVSDLSARSRETRWAERATTRFANGGVLNVLAVWADNSSSARPATAAIREHREWLSGGCSIVAGDFNNHRKWDHKRFNQKDHARTVDELSNLGLMSAFHVSHGRFETRHCEDCDAPTFWPHNKGNPHHIDFIYAPAHWIRDDPESVTVGLTRSRVGDHERVIAELEPRQI
jgi:endonuclease/exonuclease/phosphatase family metal-dependent hydrolase